METVTTIAKKEYARKIANEFIPSSKFEAVETGIKPPHGANKENIPAGIIGSAVDYRTRYLLTGDFEKSYEFALRGLRNMVIADESFSEISDPLIEKARDSVIGAVAISGCDVAYRNAFLVKQGYGNLFSVIGSGNASVIRGNVAAMADSCVDFAKRLGEVVDVGIELSNGQVHGDIDILTTEALIDIKTTKRSQKSATVNSQSKIQLVLYYLLGLESQDERIREAFNSIDKLAIYNPRHGVGYIVKISDIGEDALRAASRCLFGIMQGACFTG